MSDTTMDLDAIQADFDRIARLPHSGFSPNAVYHSFLLRFLPAPASEALDVGCGTGEFSRLLSARVEQVQGLDVSAQMVAVARERSAGFHNLEFSQANALSWNWPTDRFDCIVSIATLHHMPMAKMLDKITTALRPGGVLLVLDLMQPATLVDRLLGALAYPATFALRLLRTGQWRTPPEVRRAWDEHGKTDRYLRLQDVRDICRQRLPGAIVRRHLLWRYSIVWRKPEHE